MTDAQNGLRLFIPFDYKWLPCEGIVIQMATFMNFYVMFRVVRVIRRGIGGPVSNGFPVGVDPLALGDAVADVIPMGTCNRPLVYTQRRCTETCVSC